MNEIIVGIDLGTTNSAVAVVQDGEPRILSKGDQKIMPSVIGYSKDSGWLVGRPALNQYTLDPDNTVRSIKRKMGSSERVTLGGKALTAQEVSAFILRELKAIAKENLGQPINKAVITVPAYFTNAQRQATQEAGTIAGLDVVRIINEPTAAALAYGLNQEEDQMALVYDLGGGTFDVSLVEMMDGVVEVRASHGDTQLGGDDFDQCLADHADQLFYKNHKLSLQDNRLAQARLRRAAELAKIHLSSYADAPLREEYLAEQDGIPLHLDDQVERSDFEEMTKDLLDRTLESVEKVMEDGEIEAVDLSRVLLVGGSTRMPAVWDLVAEHLGMEPDSEINPDEVVALGAAVQAAIIAGEPVDSILVDVTPYSLGIETATIMTGQLIPDIYSILIPRNTNIPTTKEEIFHAIYSGQEAVEIKVYQGENPVASQNTLLGDFLIEGLKAAEPGEPPSINVKFDFDINGMLHVQATDRVTGKQEGTSVQATQAKLSPAEIAASRERIQGFFDTLTDEDDEVLSGEIVSALDNEAEALIQRGQVLLDEGSLEKEAEKNLRDLITALKSAQTQEEIDELSETLLDLLFDLE